MRVIEQAAKAAFIAAEIMLNPEDAWEKYPSFKKKFVAAVEAALRVVDEKRIVLLPGISFATVSCNVCGHDVGYHRNGRCHKNGCTCWQAVAKPCGSPPDIGMGFDDVRKTPIEWAPSLQEDDPRPDCVIGGEG